MDKQTDRQIKRETVNNLCFKKLIKNEQKYEQTNLQLIR